jgi:hypothetical protein
VTADARNLQRRAIDRDEATIAPGILNKFAWRPGDVEIIPGDWRVSYEDSAESGATVLVQDLDGLVQHLMQQPSYDGNLQAALDRFAARDLIRRAPMTLIADLIESADIGLREARPRKFAGLPSSSGDGTARTDYGIAVFEQCGHVCAYCGLEMLATLETSVQLTVDHIIPVRAIRRGYREDWIEDLVNLVTSCRSCHESGYRYRFDDPGPTTENDFFDLRDRVFVQRKARLAVRYARKRRDIAKELAPTSSTDPLGEPANDAD